MGLEISPVGSSRDLEAFLSLPSQLRPRDRANETPPPWLRPLLDRRANPFFRHADHQLLLARREGRPVGRVAVYVDHLSNRTLGERAGTFGLFDCVNATRVAGELLGAAERWLRGQDVDVVRGPLGPSIRVGTGVMVHGQGLPPMPGLSDDPPELSFLLEQAGYVPRRDLHAYRTEVGRIPLDVTRSADLARRRPGLVLRPVRVDRAHFSDEMMRFGEVINDLPGMGRASAPWSEAELIWVARQLKLVIDPELVLFIEQDRVPAALGVAVRNFREPLGGRSPSSMPMDFLRAAPSFKLRRLRSARVAMLAVRPRFLVDAGFGAGARTRGGLMPLLLTELLGRLRLFGVDWAEVSLVDPTDRPLVELLAAVGAEHYKTYRIYEKNLRGDEERPLSRYTGPP
jgi:hypothetical protein